MHICSEPGDYDAIRTKHVLVFVHSPKIYTSYFNFSVNNSFSFSLTIYEHTKLMAVFKSISS